MKPANKSMKTPTLKEQCAKLAELMARDTPDGFYTIVEMSDAAGISRWMMRDSMKKAVISGDFEEITYAGGKKKAYRLH